MLNIVFFICVSASFAYTPINYTFVLDASASVSDNDFKEMNANIASSIVFLYEQSQRYTGRVANQISVAWFGGPDDYQNTPYYNGSDKTKMAALLQELIYKKHPKFRATAIYTAALYGTLTSLQLEEQKGIDYLNIIFLITDGKDGNSLSEHKSMIRQLYPNDEIVLVVVGVGSGADINEFIGTADLVQSIDNFSEIMAIILAFNESAGR